MRDRDSRAQLCTRVLLRGRSLRVPSSIPSWPGLRLSAVLVLLLACGGRTAAQAPGASPSPLKSLGPAGVRSYLTDGWGTLAVLLTNPSTEDRLVRVLTYYPGAPERQYGRDVWVPAGGVVRTWYALEPPPAPSERKFIELRTLVYDLAGGRERLLPGPDGPPVRSDLARYEPREAVTAGMLEGNVGDGSQEPLADAESARVDEVRDLVRLFRRSRELSERVSWTTERFLPPVAEGWDGVRHFVLASNRLAEDDAGRATLRAWLERGGRLWVLLDRVEPRTVTALLGDAVDFRVVDRTSLTSVLVESAAGVSPADERNPRAFEEPVEFVRVVVPGHRVLHTVDGWPASFVAPVGQGLVLFTTLGPRAWYRPRGPGDPRSPFRDFPNLPVALSPLQILANELQPPAYPRTFAVKDLQPFVTDEIGYTVTSRTTVVLVFGAFLAGLLALAVVLGRRALLEHLGWAGPALAVAAAGIFVLLGEVSRRAVPPTVAVAQLADAVPGLPEVQVAGMFALYQPAATVTPIGADQGGSFDIDTGGLEGRIRRRLQLDLDRWRWENLELPPGVRTGTFRHTVRTGEPVEATARFGSAGVEGRLQAEGLHDLADLVLCTPGPRNLAVRLGPDGTFRAASTDVLAPGQYLADTLLSDRQRTRQQLYAQFLADPRPQHLVGRTTLLAWAAPLDLGFPPAQDARLTGSALLAVPVRFERTPAGERVTVPGMFVETRRVMESGARVRVPDASSLPARYRLRFQLPATVLPLDVDRARLTLHLNAPTREVVVGGFQGQVPTVLRRLQSPWGPEQVEIDDPRLLALDSEGGLHLSLEIGVGDASVGPNAAANAVPWSLELLELEVQGKRLPGAGE